MPGLRPATLRPAARPTPEADSTTRPRRDGLGWEQRAAGTRGRVLRQTPPTAPSSFSCPTPSLSLLGCARLDTDSSMARPGCVSAASTRGTVSPRARHVTSLDSPPHHSALDIVNFCIVSLSSSVAVSIRLQPPHPSSPHTLAVPGRKIIRFIIKPLSTTAKGVYLNTLPSAHSYFLPATSMGLSHAHWSLTNSRSSGLEGSSLVNS
jgi:hypothetical protein